MESERQEPLKCRNNYELNDQSLETGSNHDYQIPECTEKSTILEQLRASNESGSSSREIHTLNSNKYFEMRTSSKHLVRIAL